MADPAANRKSSVMIEAASCVYPFYSIYSVLSELLALKISSHIEFVLPDMRKDKPPFAEKVICYFSCLAHFVSGILGIVVLAIITR